MERFVVKPLTITTKRSILDVAAVLDPPLTKNYLLEEINHNDLMSEKHKKTCKYLNYVEHLLILASIVTGCVSIFAFASLVCVLVGITSSAVELKMCAITAGIKKSIIKRKKKEV